MGSPMSARPATADASIPRSGAGGWGMVLALSLMYVFSSVDRSIMTVMLDDIRGDLGITDVQVSLLQGAAFALFYTIMGLPIGGLADRYSRRAIIYVGVSFWSICSMLTGFAPRFGHIFLARMGVGLGEASLSPAAYSLLSDRFPRHRIAGPISVYSGAATLGTGLAIFAGGWLLEHFTRSTAGLPGFLADMAPWRIVLVVTGAPGLAIALLAWSFRDPGRRGTVAADAGWAACLAYLRANALLFMLLLVGFGFVVIIAYGVNTWGATYLRRSFGLSPAEAGLAIGLITSVCGLLAHAANGFVVDWLRARGHRDAPIRYFLWTAVIATPLVVLAYLVPSLPVFLAGLVIQLSLLTPVVGYAGAAVQMIAPPGMQGKLGAFYLLVLNVMGLGAGPTLVALIGQRVFGPGGNLGQALAVLVAVCAAAAALLLLACRRRFAAAVARLEASA